MFTNKDLIAVGAISFQAGGLKNHRLPVQSKREKLVNFNTDDKNENNFCHN